MANESEEEEEAYRAACGLPFSEYEKKLIEIGNKDPNTVINILLEPEFICKSYQFNSVCKILKELVKTYPIMIKSLANGLKFYDGSEEEDVERRERVKIIFMEISKENSEFDPEIIKEMCRIMFKNTGDEPFEIISEIISRNAELSFILMEGLDRRLGKEKKPIEKVYLRREMMNMLLDIIKNADTEKKASRICEGIIAQLGRDRFFEDALVEIAKKFYRIKEMVKGWDRKNERVRDGLKRVDDRLKKWEEEHKKPVSVRAQVAGFRRRKHKHGI